MAISGWNIGTQIGSPDEAFKKDYLDSKVWSSLAAYIAIARHQGGVVDAFKVFKFNKGGSSLLTRYDQIFAMGHSYMGNHIDEIYLSQELIQYDLIVMS